MNKFLIVFFLLVKIVSFAQVSAGGDNKTSKGKLTWSVGEIITEEMTNSQGSFAQPLTIQEIELVTTVAETNKKDLSVYPNPVVNVLTIDLENNSSVQIINELGVNVFSGNTNKIDMSTQLAGIYVLMILNNQSEVIGRYKIVKQ